MKILATFDRSRYSESILAQLEFMSRLPTAEITLLSVADEPAGRARRPRRRAVATEVYDQIVPVVIQTPPPSFAETKLQAVQRLRDETTDYLLGLASRLPNGTKYRIEAHVAKDAAKTIIKHARALQTDVIVMATHGRSGLAHALFGSTTEQVIRAGVAPVLVVRPPKRPKPSWKR